MSALLFSISSIAFLTGPSRLPSRVMAAVTALAALVMSVRGHGLAVGLTTLLVVAMAAASLLVLVLPKDSRASLPLAWTGVVAGLLCGVWS